MNDDKFRELLSVWAEDVKVEALRLFRDGADPNDSLKLAINIVDSRARKKMSAGPSIVELPSMVRRGN